MHEPDILGWLWFLEWYLNFKTRANGTNREYGESKYVLCYLWSMPFDSKAITEAIGVVPKKTEDQSATHGERKALTYLIGIPRNHWALRRLHWFFQSIFLAKLVERASSLQGLELRSEGMTTLHLFGTQAYSSKIDVDFEVCIARHLTDLTREVEREQAGKIRSNLPSRLNSGTRMPRSLNGRGWCYAVFSRSHSKRSPSSNYDKQTLPIILMFEWLTWSFVFSHANNLAVKISIISSADLRLIQLIVGVSR